MRISRRTFLSVFLILVAAAGILSWVLTRRDAAPPYAVTTADLTGWTLVASDGSDPWVVALTPPQSLTTSLFQDATRRSGTRLVAPAHPALPLVLRSEFDEGLQGVYGTDSVLRIARDAGVDAAEFQPVCLAHRTRKDQNGRADLYFVALESAAFNQMRVDLLPPQPEHAGIGVYEPSTLTPILIVGATDEAFDRWWPLQFDQTKDCEADLPIASVGK